MTTLSRFLDRLDAYYATPVRGAVGAGGWGILCALILWWVWDNARVIEQLTRFLGG